MLCAVSKINAAWNDEMTHSLPQSPAECFLTHRIYNYRSYKQVEFDILLLMQSLQIQGGS